VSGLPEILVVDATVVAKLYVAEEGTERAHHLLMSEHTLHAPDLLHAEVGNVLWKRVRRGELVLEYVRQVAAKLCRLPVQLHETSKLLDSALGIAVALDRTVYDSLYVALAVGLDTVLVTSDERLHHAIAASDLAGQTLLLADLPPADEDEAQRRVR
jgi:predicted nucleic acid-binding protein